MTEESGNDIQRFIEIAWRRKWAILAPFLVIFVAVTLWGLYLPNLYQSTASILIEPQKVPTEYVRSTVTSDLEARLRTVTQQMSSRTKLMKVIDELDLYPEMVAGNVPSEVLVARMRQNLSIEVPPRRPSADFFQVSFIHGEPNKAMLAVSRLVSLFIEESLHIREQQAHGTTLFIEEELQKLKEILEQQENAIQEYKSAYMGELPDQLEANLRMLDNLNTRLSGNLESQRETEDRLMLIEREISRLEGEMTVANTIMAENELETVTDTTLNQLLTQRNDQRQLVVSLEAQYTDKHPDLIAARKELARLDGRLRTVTENLASSRGEGGSSAVVATLPAVSMEMTNLRRQYNEFKPRVSSLKQEEKELRRRIKQYQERVEVAPTREQRLLQLTRDYENTKESYDDLLNKKLEATLSENLESRQQGENFQILDPANFPEKPYLPDRMKIIVLGFMGGLGSGVGLAFLLEILFPVFYSLKQIKKNNEFAIMIGIPFISSSGDRQKWGKQVLIAAGVTVLGMIFFLMLFDHFVMDVGEFISTIKANLKGMM